MWKRGLAGLAMCLAVGCASPPSEPPPTPAVTPDPGLRVLFIGNSYTFSHDLPKVLEQIASATEGRPIVTRMVAEPGYTLQQHWEDRRALAEIRGGAWDVVVLQGHSMGTLQARELFVEFGRRFDSAIREVGSRTVLFMTWARRERPAMLADVRAGYEGLGEQIGATVVPAGVAWATSWDRRPDIHLWHADGSHPSPAGTYLAAATFYDVLTGGSCVGADHAGFGQLDTEEIRALQEIAAETVGTMGGPASRGRDDPSGAEAAGQPGE